MLRSHDAGTQGREFWGALLSTCFLSFPVFELWKFEAQRDWGVEDLFQGHMVVTALAFMSPCWANTC